LHVKLYHMSDTLRLGDMLTLDFKRTAGLAQPFVQALEKSEDCFYAMVLNGKYLRAVLGRFRLWEWSDYVKWSVEGAFEFIRKTEFPHCCSRIACHYFMTILKPVKRCMNSTGDRRRKRSGIRFICLKWSWKRIQSKNAICASMMRPMTP